MRKKLIEIRKKKGYTQKTLAKELNISRGAYAGYEAGIFAPSLKISMQIKEKLNYHKDDIFFNS